MLIEVDVKFKWLNLVAKAEYCHYDGILEAPRIFHRSRGIDTEISDKLYDKISETDVVNAFGRATLSERDDFNMMPRKF